MARSLVLCGLVLLLGQVGFAQTNVEVNQGIQFDFSNPGARSLAMGGAFTGLADDATAAYANPAGLRALTKTEVSFEGQAFELKSTYASGGRLAGTPSGIGIDTLSSPTFSTFSTTKTVPAFVSIAYASAKRPYALALYRHQTTDFSTNIQTSGPFTFNPLFSVGSQNDARFFPATGDLSLRIANYGAAASYKWQNSAGADRVAIGGGVSYYTFSINSQVTRYYFNNVIATGAGDLFGPAVYTTPINQQTQQGSDHAWGGSLGVLLIPSDKIQIGASFRQGPSFTFTAANNCINSAGFAPCPGGASYTPFVTNGKPDVTAAHFNVPHVASVGLVVAPIRSTKLLVDYDYVGFARMTDGFVNVFKINDTETSGDFNNAANYFIKNAHQVHAGFEQQFGGTVSPALRFGTWYDPAHALQNSTGFTQFVAGSNVWHFSVGGGISMKGFELSVGGDFSSRGNKASISLVARL